VKDETKTGGEREVHLSDDLLTAIREHITWLKVEAAVRGSDEVMWLFPNEAGRTLDLSKVRKVFGKVLERAEIPHHRLYDLRHTFGSLLFNQTGPITYVANQMGHASPDITLRYYARWLPSDKKSFAHLLDMTPEAKPATSSATKPDFEGVGASQVVESKWSRRVELNHRPADSASDYRA